MPRQDGAISEEAMVSGCEKPNSKLSRCDVAVHKAILALKELRQIHRRVAHKMLRGRRVRIMTA